MDVLESFSEFGSKEASGELLGEPVDIGEPGAGAGAVVAGGGTSRRSRKGFLLLFGEEKGFDRPIVANFWPAPNGLLVCVCVGDEVGCTKLLVKGLVLFRALLALSVVLALALLAALV